jgi:hypothetical protein
MGVSACRGVGVTKVLKGFEYIRNRLLPVSEPVRISFLPDLRGLRVDLLYADTPIRRHAASAPLTCRSQCRGGRFPFQTPEQQPLRIVKQQMMSSAQLHEDHIVAAIGSARYQASTA